MKRILDSSFRYRASFATDVRKTFERVRRQQQQEQAKPQSGEGRVRVLQLDQLKKANSAS